MRLIDADELIEVAHRARLDSRERIERMIESAPTVGIDAITESHEKIGYDKGFRDGYAQATSEVRHGRWIYDFASPLKCSSCGIVSKANEITLRKDFKFCPYCGAKMDGVEDA